MIKYYLITKQNVEINWKNSHTEPFLSLAVNVCVYVLKDQSGKFIKPNLAQSNIHPSK